MKVFFCLFIVLLALPAFAVPGEVNALGTTLYQLAGDVSSGGDIMPGAEEPSLMELIEGQFTNRTLLSCNVFAATANFPFEAIEVSKSLSDWEDKGAIRLSRPGEAGGAKLVFLETYRGSTQIDPTTGQVSIKYVADSVNSHGVVTNTFIIQIEAQAKNGLVEITDVDFMYTSLNKTSVYGNTSDGKTKCDWGGLKTEWD